MRAPWRGKLGWDLPPEDPAELARTWAAELDGYGVSRAALIASVPGDEASVLAAPAACPGPISRLRHGQSAGRECRRGRRASRTVCLFPAMHRYSLHDPRVAAAARAGGGPGLRRVRALRSAHRGGAQEARAALALRHALLQSARPARHGAALIRECGSSFRISARAIFAKRSCWRTSAPTCTWTPPAATRGCATKDST